MKTEEELLDLKKDVETAKTRSAEKTGQKNALMKQLKDEWSFKQTAEGDKRISELLTKLHKLDLDIADKTTKLEQEYNI